MTQHVQHQRVEQCEGNTCTAILMALLRREGVEFQLTVEEGGFPAWEAGFHTKAVTPPAVHAISKWSDALAHHADRALLLLMGELGGRN